MPKVGTEPIGPQKRHTTLRNSASRPARRRPWGGLRSFSRRRSGYRARPRRQDPGEDGEQPSPVPVTVNAYGYASSAANLGKHPRARRCGLAGTDYWLARSRAWVSLQPGSGILDRAPACRGWKVWKTVGTASAGLPRADVHPASPQPPQSTLSGPSGFAAGAALIGRVGV